MLYFFPGLERKALKLEREWLAEMALDASWRDVSPADLECRELLGAGPGGASGLLVALRPAHGGSAATVRYESAGQVWNAWGDSLWLGWQREQPPPGPDELARRRQLRGHEVELGDRRRWNVAAVVEFGSTNPLIDQSLLRQPDGSLRLEVLPEYQELWETAGTLLQKMFQPAAERKMTTTLIARALEQFLGVNHRLGPAEISVLRLVGTGQIEGVIRAALDWPLVEAALSDEPQKKTGSS